MSEKNTRVRIHQSLMVQNLLEELEFERVVSIGAPKAADEGGKRRLDNGGLQSPVSPTGQTRKCRNLGKHISI